MENTIANKELLEHYEIETELAAKLRNASSKDRECLYSSLYDELYRRLPDQAQLTRKASSEEQSIVTNFQLKLMKHLINKKTLFLEIGPGDCSFSFAVSKLVKQVYAVDVSKIITSNNNVPDNFKLILSNGTNIPVPANSVNFAYSTQLIEHLHPDDAINQLKNTFKALSSGGKYLCITPNRINGPHDISRDFDTIATGFHLKEYTVKELSSLFKLVGFRKVSCYIGARNWYLKVPPFVPILVEKIMESFPIKFRKKISNTVLIRALLNINLIGVK
jgi:SAM-dependent methyltransferase